MTDPSGGAFFHDLIEGVIIWEDSDSGDVAAKAPVDVTLAVNVPAEATELPVQAVADARDAHTIEAHQLGDAMGHDLSGSSHDNVVMDVHHVDASPMAGEPDAGGPLISHHDDSSDATGA